MIAASSARAAGAALVAGSALLTAGNILHPRESFIGEIMSSNPEQVALLMFETFDRYQFSHLILLPVGPLLLLGVVFLYGALAERGAREHALAALVSLGVFANLFPLIIAIDGFADPALARQYLATPAGERAVVAALFDFSGLILHTLLAPAFFALWLGSGLFAASLLRASLCPRPITWIGITLGVVGIVGYAAGVFGPYWVFSTPFAPYAVAYTLWWFVIGVYTLRRGITPLGDLRRPEPAGATPAAR